MRKGAFVKYFLRSVFAVAFLCAISALSGCKPSHSVDGRPEVLRYAYSPAAEQLEAGAVRSKIMKAYLEKQLGMPVEVVLVDGYGPTIEAMRTEKVDLANFGALSYLIAAQKANAQAIVATGFPNGQIGGYRSVIAVPKNSPYHSLQDLKEHSKDIVFVLADPASTSGNLYPRVGLQNIGIDPERDFKKVIFAGPGGHVSVAMDLKAAKVDAGGFMLTAYKRLIQTGKLNADDIRILWQSDLIPVSPVAVRGNLPEAFKKKIQAALIAMPQKEPKLWATLRSAYPMPEGGSIYVPVTDSTYDGLRHYTAQVKDFSFVEK
jgi:phosphonate transport system substrate-binding protein